MALLPSGEYKLIEKDGVRDKKKSLLFVKLTDSAHRALSDFLKNQVSKSNNIAFISNILHKLKDIKKYTCKLKNNI